MVDPSSAPTPVWTLATEPVAVPSLFDGETMTSEGLAQLRTVLASLVSTPIATLEAHPMDRMRDRTLGVPLHAASPLAQQLTDLLKRTAQSAPPKVDIDTSTEVLYRMVVPSRVAEQLGQGLVRPMKAKGVVDGIRSAVVDKSGIAGQVAFVRVGGNAAAAGSGAGAGSVAAAGAVAASAGVVTVAAPLVLMAVATALSIHAENERQKSIERITTLLEQLHEDRLDDERSELEGCRDAIEKAAAIVLDQGRIGMALGLDAAVHEIDKSIQLTRRRLMKWQAALTALPNGPVDLASLTGAFPGLDGTGGLFRAHLEIARLALALKRRVLVLQAVEHAQLEGANHPYRTFVQVLQEDQRRVDELETSLRGVLLKLSSLELKRAGGFRSPVYSAGEVDKLLQAAYRLRAFREESESASERGDVAIEIERRRDGSLVVFPAVAA